MDFFKRPGHIRPGKFLSEVIAYWVHEKVKHSRELKWHNFSSFFAPVIGSRPHQVQQVRARKVCQCLYALILFARVAWKIHYEMVTHIGFFSKDIRTNRAQISLRSHLTRCGVNKDRRIKVVFLLLLWKLNSFWKVMWCFVIGTRLIPNIKL